MTSSEKCNLMFRHRAWQQRARSGSGGGAAAAVAALARSLADGSSGAAGIDPEVLAPSDALLSGCCALASHRIGERAEARMLHDMVDVVGDRPFADEAERCLLRKRRLRDEGPCKGVSYYDGRHSRIPSSELRDEGLCKGVSFYDGRRTGAPHTFYDS
ncbi:hypothetical protein JKP88DRAFT_287988 [Tribonema minus]|uniref:Uncharacterized protein n=1 Tax=Tribonema minus TaxID=303371 RepID=A0A835Z6L8_9STRA|nr:hypothetical protein JKP88DRAFT_287988 [Tribonema minus]